MLEPSAEEDRIAKEVVDASIVVHRELGPGLLESIYEVCLADVLRQRGFKIDLQKSMPIKFQGRLIEGGFRSDIIVDDKVLIEVKSVETLSGIHEAQILTYLKLTGISLGFLMNFNAKLMKDGIKRYYKSP